MTPDTLLNDDGEYEDCPECGGEGFVEADCDEDSCCCAEPHDLIPCPNCTPRTREPK